MKITKCTGEGQGSCKRCSDKGKWNRMWCCFLYKIEGYEGCYCADCVKEIMEEKSKIGEFVTTMYGVCGFVEEVIYKKHKVYYKIRDEKGELHTYRSTSLI